MGKTEGGGGGGGVCAALGLCLVLVAVLGGAVLYLELRSERQMGAASGRIDALARELAALREAVAQLDNRTAVHHATTNDKESRRRQEHNEEEGAVEEEDEEYYTGDYDDPNADDGEYDDEEEEGDYDNMKPSRTAELQGGRTAAATLRRHAGGHRLDDSPAPPETSIERSTTTGRAETRRKRASMLLRNILRNLNVPDRISLNATRRNDNRNSTREMRNHKYHTVDTAKLIADVNRFQELKNSTVISLGDLLQIVETKRHPDSNFNKTDEYSKHLAHRKKRKAGHREDVEIFTNNEFAPAAVTVAAHYAADETKCQNVRHKHCDHNHRRYHPNQLLKDWQDAGFMNLLSTSNSFHMNEGILRIDSAGVYFVYAQIFYLDVHDVSGFRIYQNNVPIIQCTSHTSHGNESARHVHKRNSCFTASLVHLRKGDQLTLRETEENRYTSFEKTRSFFGLFKVGNI